MTGSQKRKLQEVVQPSMQSDAKRAHHETQKAVTLEAFDNFTRALYQLWEIAPSANEVPVVLDGTGNGVNTEKFLHAAAMKRMKDRGEFNWVTKFLPASQGADFYEPGEAWPPRLPPINSPELCRRVFTHRSYAPTAVSNPDPNTHNERLEFLGDSYLNHTVTRLLYERFPHRREGELSTMRAHLVGNTMAMKFSELYQFPGRLLLSEGAQQDGVRNLPKVKADIFEAYIGGVVLDSPAGPDTVFIWLKQLLEPELRIVDQSLNQTTQLDRMAKQTLYNLLGGKQARVVYHWVGGKGGGGADGGYVMACYVDGKEAARAHAMNQKDAGIKAAMIVVERLKAGKSPWAEEEQPDRFE
ncbi:hypothetical protein G7K_1959-t1 [Saitoella complicata NRRL Y-17804]|uniref:ribonuclease III n=2 Tax=Saitoella complicata (strain BCRC 22490 / CBS 7301 / JCM 7358 / NBRC 10748 / NRRL Y-17804) TaxID=698492 RepID=A0A0E9NEC1_SAICN|nr:hypothetical protein G7K_1959-t1 [Saitoella complicata NRRL Y-17804]